MANNIFVSYDLMNPGQNYDSVIETIKKLGTWAKIHQSYWHVKTHCSAKEAAEIIWQTMDRNDKLFVVDTSNNDAYWYNLPETVTEHIQKNWRL